MKKENIIRAADQAKENTEEIIKTGNPLAGLENIPGAIVRKSILKVKKKYDAGQEQIKELIVKKAKKPKHRSRATRCADACSTLGSFSEQLQELADEIELLEDDKPGMTEEEKLDAIEEVKEKIIEAQGILADIKNPTSELSELKEELEGWHDNMSGTALENTQKYQTLEDAVSILDDVVNNLEMIDQNPEDAEGIRSEADSIESAIGDAENVEFPTMYS